MEWETFLCISVFLFSGKFDNLGIATGVPDESIGKVQTLRLHVHSESDNWAILSEVGIILFLFFCCKFLVMEYSFAI